jgi:hypothetical protein
MSGLSGVYTKTAGTLRFMNRDDEGGVTYDPQYRRRLDHYGNDGDGWDEEGWEEDYAGPLRREVRGLLAKQNANATYEVSIGDKGHVHVRKV